MLYILIALISSAASSVVVVMSLSVLGLAPYTVMVIEIGAVAILGNLIERISFLVINGVVKRRLGLIWWDVLGE